MNRRLVKEMRLLLLPWSIAVVAGAVLAVKLASDGGLIESSAVIYVAAFTFFGTLVIASALSFGSEFQQRTLPLLLAQPLSRARLWSEKQLALAIAVGAAVLIYSILQLLAFVIRYFQIPYHFQLQWDVIIPPTLLAGTFLLATICSIGFWTLIARSTIGGMMFCLSSLFLLGLGAVFISQKINEPYVLHFGDSKTARSVALTWLIYSLVFLWLGWRMFARLEVKGLAFDGGGALSLSRPDRVGKWWSDRLRCRPQGAILNLLRKELRLQTPVFQVAGMFSVCWFATLMLLLLQPAQKEIYETIFTFLTGFYVPLAMVLAGSISLGEEKTLGLTTWHLTLPISAWRQWLVKLGVAGVVAMVLGWAIPWLLAWITSPKANVGLFALLHSRDGGWQMLLLVSSLVLVMSFWAATLLGNAVRAALVTVISLLVLFGCAWTGAWCGGVLAALATPLLMGIMAHFQLSPSVFNTLNPVFFGTLFFIALLVVLVQSFVQFRSSQPAPWVILKYSLVLIGMTFFVFCSAIFAVSAGEQSSRRLVGELQEALQSLPAEERAVPWEHGGDVTLQALIKTGKLSRSTKIWLRDASVTVHPPWNGSIPTTGQGHRLPVRCRVTVSLPNGKQFFFYDEERLALN